MIIDFNRNVDNYLDITFQPQWDNIRITKSFLEKYLLVNVFDKKSISRIVMSASELLENAIKSSMRTSAKKNVRLVIKKSHTDDRIELEVMNATKKGEAVQVVNRIKEMNKEEPLQYYLNKMKEIVTKKNISGDLGLARIHCEGEAKVKAEYDEKSGILKVKAIF